ncbi:hypothetical protein WJX79_010424 [Trebouxia sp. C0005]
MTPWRSVSEATNRERTHSTAERWLQKCVARPRSGSHAAAGTPAFHIRPTLWGMGLPCTECCHSSEMTGRHLGP